MKLVLIVVAGSALSCGGKPAPGNTSPDHTTTTTTEPVAGAANLVLACRSAAPSCESPGYDMTVLGDRVRLCETQSNGTSIRLQLESSNDEHDLITVAFDGYHGPDTYALDEPNSRFLSVDDHVSFAECNGTINVGKRVTAADPNCGSPACSVRIDDAAATAPFPKPLTFTVHCTSLCENGSDVTCPGPIDFITDASCT